MDSNELNALIEKYKSQLLDMASLGKGGSANTPLNDTTDYTNPGSTILNNPSGMPSVPLTANHEDVPHAPAPGKLDLAAPSPLESDPDYVHLNPPATQELFNDGEATTIQENYEEFLKRNTKTGTLKIQAFNIINVIPIPRVKITVTKDFTDGNKMFFQGETDQNGIIDNIELPAPDKKLSIFPSDEAPFETYDIIAETPNFIKEKYVQSPIFDGIQSVQNARLSPKR